MESEVRSQLGRMAFVLCAFLALAGWQFDFVLQSIEANVYLNMTIIATFVFGVFLAFRAVFTLGNELTALTALKVQYQDRGTLPDGCYDKPATVFAVPQLLGHAFRLISDELNQPKRLIIPQATVKMLVESVEVRIDDRKSALTYIVGLLVFLGLIGTFVGLMKTVGSVGDIIGSLNFGGDSGQSVDTAFQGLIADLKGPLVGMATGFSSSLFGLICSLALGLMERFGTTAHRIIPVEFESWLSNVVRLEEAENEISVDDSAADAITRIAKLEVKMSETAGLARKSTEIVAELLVSVHAIAEKLSQDEARSGYATLSDLARQMATTQRGFVDQLDLMRDYAARSDERTAQMSAQISTGFAELAQDRAAEREALMQLSSNLKKQQPSTAAAFGEATAPVQDLQRKLEKALVSQSDLATAPYDQGANVFSYAKQKMRQRALDKQAKQLRAEYHDMVREMLEKAFKRDGDIAAELDRIRVAEGRHDATLASLIEHSQAMSVQQRTLSSQLAGLAELLAEDRGDTLVMDEIRRSRLGMDLALRQIAAQLSQTRDAMETQAIVEASRALPEQQKAG
ncbi:MAG: hypothetical protein AAF862_14245 [Pseudomonadota bacterium]